MGRDLIKQLRERMSDLGITQFRLAEELDLTPVAVNNWFTGVSCPSFTNFLAMLKILKLDVVVIPNESN